MVNNLTYMKMEALAKGQKRRNDNYLAVKTSTTPSHFANDLKDSHRGALTCKEKLEIPIPS